MKIEIELNIVDDKTYLNYWDWKNGRDVCCEVKDGELFEFVHDPAENEELEKQQVDYDPFEQREISLQDFIEKVKGRQ